MSLSVSPPPAAAPSSSCSFLTQHFQAFPVGRRGFWQDVVHNATYQPSMTNKLSYPTRQNLFQLLYHSDKSPYDGMAPRHRPAQGAEGFTFSFAAKYRKNIAKFVLEKLGGYPRFVIEVGSYLGSGAVNAWAPLARKGNGTLLCVDTWQGDLHMRLKHVGKSNPGYLRFEKGMPHLHDAFMQQMVDRNQTEVVFPLPIPSILGARLLATTAWMIDLIYLDSAHERGETLIEIHLYYQLLRPGGVLLGDDYRDFPAVRDDVDEFARCEGVTVLTGKDLWPNTWAIVKPANARRGPRGPLGVGGVAPELAAR